MRKLPKVDVVIVGVGWAGGIIASELAKNGLKVVGLERGKERKTEDYFMVHDELRYAYRYELMQDLSKETITFRSNEKIRALPMRQYGSFLIGNGIGGAGVHWNGQTYRFLPYDFEIKSKTIERYGKNKIPNGMTIQNWGITYDQLEPYYDKFEKMAGISGEENPLAGKRSSKYPTPPMKSSPAMKMFMETAKKMKLHPYILPSANLSQAYTNPDGVARSACQYCGFCERFGCEYGAKADPVVTVIPVAKKTGNFEIRTHSYVRRILHKGNKAIGVMYTDVTTGEEIEQPADIVVIASYVFNNVRLLLNSKLGRPYDPATGRGVIGKNYAYQVMRGNAIGFFENKEFNTFAGAGALGVTLDDYNGDNFDHSDLKFIHGASISLTQTGLRPIANNPVPKGTPSWGKEFKRQSIKYANRSLTVAAQGASMPFRHHFLDLDPTYKDVFGDPLIRITFDFEEQDRQLALFLATKCEEILKQMGADRVDANKELGPYDIVPYQSTHNTGGVIMGDSPDSSAVNSYLQMWDAENVFVVGASAFPHNSGYNPTGTVGALSYRAAEGILKYSKKGGPVV
ncbi:GMC family oxidoreductase [Aneurinibacillus thermoaerophilus]|uniref:Gluconate 2-dehydrogenase alpha chain n=1 Tax=Aneurinibacillus thermoaerophilus TaxID=143495 RepID=A0A1G8C691_ANETH|nr:GMC family oxidoreductase [Aneurinibacillus thermoaerophilus]MED0679174.1 GMC family oxidoreductase [Aneurinibacillus thermoaerophilus]MED0757484.1 GMC family oxidoreductase [Aneurinibacillus thermoaerophilus]MED0761799.1 GMC family oxidoreductase [Aneurinibacillus thermoaerophilus]MED0765793.1 GMC family oxidoreductase [Aneurinibacillus thermoaerophilus]SDH40915.1 gluconate 2-dehydrogenase alpha chain [Aneurinibacillus thermoaerophilus]